jgi:hypothetical protein
MSPARLIRPYEHLPYDPLIWVKYLRAFRERHHHRPLPKIPHTPKCLFELEKVLVAADMFTEEFRQLAVEAIEDGPETGEVLSREESYRLRRALLLFELYCQFFRQHHGHRDAGRNGRVAEQMSFLQSISLFLLGELDAVYGVVDEIVLGHFRVFCCGGRVSHPLRPGMQSTPSPAIVGYLYSHGLVYLHHLVKDQYGRGCFATEACECCFGGQTNRFFNLPIMKSIKH